jgi:hypothetical protein
MREKIVNVDVGNYYQITNASYEKFLDTPFTLIYRNATINDNNEEIHWVELYKINYSQIPTSFYEETFN